MTDEALDGLARQLLLDAARLEYRDIIQSDEQHTFSPSFERKMKKLVRRADHPVRHRVTQTVACVALVVIIGGGSVLAVSAEARAAFFGWVREVYEEVFSYHYEGADALTPENAVYLPAWLPEGFELVMEPEPGDVSASIYANDTTGEKFTIQYAISSEGTIIEVERDQVDAKSVFVGDWPADLYLDRNEGEPNVLVWENTDVGAMFLISADLPQEDIIRIAESLELVEVEE